LLWNVASSPATLLVLNAERIVYAGAELYMDHARWDDAFRRKTRLLAFIGNAADQEAALTDLPPALR
jgi:hypothetical protein